MTFPTAVNHQVTDENSQNNVTNVAHSPAVAAGVKGLTAKENALGETFYVSPIKCGQNGYFVRFS